MRFPPVLPRVRLMGNSLPGSKSVAEVYAKRMHTSEPIAAGLCNAALHNDRTALSYLWIAIELKLNILMVSGNPDVDGLKNAMSAFVPMYHDVLDFRECRNGNEYRSNFAKPASAGNAGFADKLAVATRAVPDRIVTDAAARDLKDVFSVSKYGISFISSITGNHENASLVKALRKRPFNLKDGNMSALDVVVTVSRNNRISRITEYRWIERAELIIRDGNMAAKRYSNMNILFHGEINPCINASKVVEMYARQSIATIDEAKAELGKRAEFLDSLREYSVLDQMRNPIPLYYDIK